MYEEPVTHHCFKIKHKGAVKGGAISEPCQKGTDENEVEMYRSNKETKRCLLLLTGQPLFVLVLVG